MLSSHSDISDLKPYINCSEFAKYTASINNGQWQCFGPCQTSPNYCHQSGNCLNDIYKGAICRYAIMSDFSVFAIRKLIHHIKYTLNLTLYSSFIQGVTKLAWSNFMVHSVNIQSHFSQQMGDKQLSAWIIQKQLFQYQVRRFHPVFLCSRR